MALPPHRRALPPALPDEMVEEILLRIPPEEPARLVRASIVCKAWGGIVSHPAFRRRLHDIYAPSLLGFLHDWDDDDVPSFIPTTASPFSLAAPDRRSWQALDFRHGRALFLSKGKGANELLLWEPITGAQQHVLVPPEFQGDYTPAAAVFCAADDCDHIDCLGGPFSVVFVFAVDDEDDEVDTSASVYSSDTGAWGKVTSMHSEFMMDFGHYSSVLVGRSLLYFMSNGMVILEYDLVRNSLAVIDTPNYQLGYTSTAVSDYRFKLMLTEDGGLGVTEELGWHLRLWKRVASDGTDAKWVVSCTISLEKLLPTGPLLVSDAVLMLGFAEGANIIFVNTVAGLIIIDLQLGLAKKVWDDCGFCSLIPIVSFYTPVLRCEYQYLPGSKSIEETSGEGESSGTTVDLPGSKSIEETSGEGESSGTS